jgi:hypothetical protein
MKYRHDYILLVDASLLDKKREIPNNILDGGMGDLEEPLSDPLPLQGTHSHRKQDGDRLSVM